MGITPVDAGSHTPAYGPADLTTCDREPIHVPGAIQPHGVLLGLADDLTITTVSRNCGRLLGVSAEQALGQPAANLLGPAGAALVDRGVGEAPASELFAAVLPDTGPGQWRGREVEMRAHRHAGRLVVEIEPLDATGSASLVPLRATSGAIARLSRCTTVRTLAEQLVTEIRTVLGFDRVMVYRFDDEWNGEVIAEARRENLNSFLGLHYPATDIPAQARRLYTVNWVRLIADIGYEPVPLHPVVDPGSGLPLDLSHAALRSVSPIHVEYLTNMGVTASMSVSLIEAGELWGLVACHHYSGPHRPGHDARAAAELLGQVASQLFSDREYAERRDTQLAKRSQVDELTARVSAHSSDPLLAVLLDPDLLTAFDASGAALGRRGSIATTGECPDEETLRGIDRVMRELGEEVTATDRLDDLAPGLGAGADVAGVLRLNLGTDDWLLLFRPELVRFVDWGGDPTNKLLAQQEGPEVRLSPRQSFDKWRQVVRDRSRPWTQADREAAEALGRRLTTLQLLRSREQLELAESLQRSVVLDRAPAMDGVQVTAAYLPASGLQLGGDWWDAVDLGDGRSAFVVGDVAGHGVTAASAMVQIRSALRAYLLEGHGPETCLDYLDAFLVDLMSDQVATVVIAVVDRLTGAVQLASAGHLPPLLVDPTGARLLEPGSRPPLGVGAASASASLFLLRPDATLLLYTDGLVERRGTDIYSSLEVLRFAARGGGSGDLSAWTTDLVARLGVKGDDDTTLLAVRLDAAARS